MNYLFRESTISNLAESVLIIGKHILVHHHFRIRVFDLKMELVRERFFFEKIIRIKKIDEETFFIIFDGNKMTQCDVNFNPICLRIIDGNDCDVYNNTCIIKNQILIQIFNIKTDIIREFRFASIGIKNVSRMLLMHNFVPTLLVCTDDNICNVISLDVEPAKVDEFDILDNLIFFVTTKNFIIFANRNFIQIKYRRDVVVIKLNNNFDTSILNNTLKNMVFTPIYDDSEEVKSIFLESPQIFCKDDKIFIINQNGELFKLDLKLDNKKILNIKLSYEMKIERPSCIDFTDDFVCIGSCTGDTTLYLFDELQNIDGRKTKDLVEIGRLESIGTITDFSIDMNHEMTLLTTKGIYKAIETIELLIFKKLRLDFKILEMKVINNQIIMKKEDQIFNLNEDLKISKAECAYEDFDSCIEDKYKIVLNDDSVLNVYLGEKLIASFQGVSQFAYKDRKIVLIRNLMFQFVDLSTLKIEFFSSMLFEFENEIFNEEVIAGDSLEDMNFETSLQPYKELENNRSIESIVEVLVFKKKQYYLIFRTIKQLYIYKYNHKKITKMIVKKPLLFGIELKALFDLGDCIYCKSKHPCFIVFDKGDVFFYDSNIKLGYPVMYNGWLFGVSKGQLLKCKTILERDTIFAEGFILKKLNEFNDTDFNQLESVVDRLKNSIECKENNTSSIVTDKNENTQIHLIEEYRYSPMPRRIISLYDCNVLSVAKYVPFTYIPFIPTVHLTGGPDGKPRSEPIDKEEAERVDKNPCLHGRTLRYFIELRTLDFKLISSVVMEENEFICDMKIMFKNFLVVCTSFPEGENTMVKGKLTVFSLVNIVPDPKNPHITKKFKLICSETFKNACMWCEEVRSLIAVCIGTKLMVYEFNENTGLAAIGRNEISLLSTSLFTTKNFIAVSDLYNGIYFFFLRPRDPLKMHILGRSCKVEECRYISGFDFVSRNDEKVYLSLVSLNKSGIVNIFTYSPYYPGSKNGEFLIKRAEISTKFKNPLYYTKLRQINSSEVGLVSLNVLYRIRSIDIPNIQVILNCIAYFINDRAGINARNYLETEAFVNPECKSVVSESVALQFFYFKPSVQNKICELTGLSYSKIVSVIEECLYDYVRR